MEQSFIAFLEDSIKKNWDLDALTDYKGATLQYKDVARKIEKLHIIFELSGIKLPSWLPLHTEQSLFPFFTNSNRTTFII